MPAWLPSCSVKAKRSSMPATNPPRKRAMHASVPASETRIGGPISKMTTWCGAGSSRRRHSVGERST
jgi:hypothetical protein